MNFHIFNTPPNNHQASTLSLFHRLHLAISPKGFRSTKVSDERIVLEWETIQNVSLDEFNIFGFYSLWNHGRDVNSNERWFAKIRGHIKEPRSTTTPGTNN